MKKAIRGLAFSILLVLIVGRTYHILSWKDTTGGYLSSTQQMYATDDNLMDVIFMGSSHCYCSINPALLWNRYGMAAFDMSVSGQDKDSTYYTLIETLKTQSPQIVCIDAYGLLFNEQGVLGNVYRNMLSMKLSRNSNELIRSYVSEDEQMDYLLRWPIIHTRYRELGKYDFVQYEPSIYGRGFNFSDHTGSSYGPDASVLACTERTPLSEKNKEWLDRLITLSKEYDFELMMFVAPFAASLEDQKILNGAEAYLTENDIRFLDFNKLVQQLGLDYNTDFTDAFHTNYLGADKVTAYMGEYLLDIQDFTDHRGDDAYYLWDLNAEYDAQCHNAAWLAGQSDLSSFLSAASSFPNLTLVVSLDGAYMDSTLDFLSPLLELGITEAEYILGGKWIFSDGELLYHMEQETSDTFILDLNDTDTLLIQNSYSGEDAGTSTSIMLNTTSLYNNTPGLTVIVYDNFQGILLEHRVYY